MSLATRNKTISYRSNDEGGNGQNCKSDNKDNWPTDAGGGRSSLGLLDLPRGTGGGLPRDPLGDVSVSVRVCVCVLCVCASCTSKTMAAALSFALAQNSLVCRAASSRTSRSRTVVGL